MIHWVTILIGIFLMSLSLSNPLYNLIIKKKFFTSILLQIFIRIFLFIISVVVILLGIYFESIF
ncbi:MAG: hypothetical protein CMP16_01000 [Rickettsiales bacterium]|nr:hypothetical protein [Rickettsiales bacterium]